MSERTMAEIIPFSRASFFERCTASDGSFNINLLRPSLPNDPTADFTEREWALMDEKLRRSYDMRIEFTKTLFDAGLVFESREDVDYIEAIDKCNLVRLIPYTKTQVTLPIIHYEFPKPDLLEIRIGNVDRCELSGRRLAEGIEKLAFEMILDDRIGGVSHLKFDEPITPRHLLDKILAAKRELQMKDFFGPYMVFYSGLGQFNCATGMISLEIMLDDDYKPGDQSTRDRIKEVDGIDDVLGVDHLESSVIMVVNMTSDVVRLVRAIRPVAIRWAPDVYMAVTVGFVQVRSNFNKQTGVCVIS